MKNEIRGYVFMSYALACFLAKYLKGDSIFVWADGDYRISLSTIDILSILFTVIAVMFFVVASRENTVHGLDQKLRNQELWRINDVLQLKAELVSLENIKDSSLACQFVLDVEQKLPLSTDAGKDVSIVLNAVAEVNKETIVLKGLSDTEFLLSTDKQQQFICKYEAPAKTECILLEVTMQDGAQCYQRQYEFYPAHYL